jgi:hypothetical protein
LKSRNVTQDGKDPIDHPQATHLFKWQEKRFAPWELAKYAHYCDVHASGHGHNSKEYIHRFREDPNLRQDCLADLEQRGVYLFTYVDKDYRKDDVLLDGANSPDYSSTLSSESRAANVGACSS